MQHFVGLLLHVYLLCYIGAGGVQHVHISKRYFYALVYHKYCAKVVRMPSTSICYLKEPHV